MSMLRVSVDTGGTFTDVVAVYGDGRVHALKTPSTPADPSASLLTGIREAVAQSGMAMTDLDLVAHGTTSATNAVLEHRFEGLGLLVTDGFRHILEIARQSVPDGYGNSFFWVKPPRLVPLHLVREATGRMDYTGTVLRELDEEQVVEAVQQLVDQGVNRLGVCLLHSYANDAHERRVADLLASRFPDLFVSLSSEVLPEYREYERAMTTLVDVMVKPYVREYLSRAHDELNEEAGTTPLLIMQSNGGVVSAEAAGERPVTMLLSGPAAGVLGAVHVAEQAGLTDILTLDAGGTSTDICLVENLTPLVTTHALIENYPVKTPMLDIATVAAGGGSIARIGEFNSLKVGPRSVGAVPGPICYGNGGTELSVTDAAVTLGWLPAAFIGGGLVLDVEASRAAFVDFGARLGIAPEAAAAGVLEIAAANQVHGIRQVTTTKGRDPADYTLVAFGGSGPVLAAISADFLGIKSILVPPFPGNLSAYGLQVSDVRRDYVRTLVRLESTSDPAEIEQQWQALEDRGRADLREQGIAEENWELRRLADMRYYGEAHEVRVTIPEGETGEEALRSMWKDFHSAHEQVCGFAYEGEQEVELVQLRVQAVGKMYRPPSMQLAGSGDFSSIGSRRVYWKSEGWIDTPLYDRYELPNGARIASPAVIQEYGSTIVVPPGWRAAVDEHGNIRMEATQ